MPDQLLPPLDLSQLQPQPQLSDIFAPDPADAEREKLLWEKINRGPRQRSKELEAEMWKDRYGVQESSGKFRRFLAGLGETARGIGGGAAYKSIPDQAAERGMKEYQAEVGPLQRELGVLSQSRAAAMKVQQKAQSDAEANKIKQVLAMSRMGVDQANIAKVLGITEPEQAKILETLAKAGNQEAEAALRARQTINAEKTLGLTGDTGAAMALGGTDKFLTNLDKITALKGLNKNIGGSQGTMQNLPSQTTREQFIPGPNGLERVVTNSTTVSPRRVPGAGMSPDAVSKLKASILGGQSAPEETATPQIAQQIPSPQIPSGPVEARQLPPRRVPHEFQYFDGRGYKPTNIHPSQESALKAFKGDQPLPEWLAARFKHEVLPGTGRKTADDNVRSQFDDAANELFRSATDSYSTGKLDSLTGLWPNFSTKLKSMQSGGLSLGDVKTRSDAVNAMALKILDLSGKAVTESERRILSTPLPDLSMDSDTTLLYKSILLNQVSRRMQYLRGMKLTDPEMNALKSAAEPELKKNMDRQLAILTSLGQAAKIGNTDPKGTVTISIPGAKPLPMTRQEARDLLLKLSRSDFDILTKSLYTLGK